MDIVECDTFPACSQQETPTQNNNSESCVICLEAIPSPCKAVVTCGHQFCLECIRGWVQTNRVCPLCKMEITWMRHTFADDGTHTTEEVCGAIGAVPQSAPPVIEDDLMCLDHQYFIAEVHRLLAAAERIHRQLDTDRRTTRGLSQWEAQQLEIVVDLVATLRNHKRHLQAMLQFDPHVLLKDLYQMQESMDQLFEGPPQARRGQSPPSAPVRYSAYDAWNADVSDDDELAEDMAYLNVGKSRSKSRNKGKKSKEAVPPKAKTASKR